MKKRGRPRVEKQGESNADRRRAQVRIAQRAYRQRKDFTLDTLRQQVASLAAIIEQQNKAFVGYCDRMVSAGLSDTQMSEISEATLCFAELLESAHAIYQEDDASEKIESSCSTRTNQKVSSPGFPLANTRLSEGSAILSTVPSASLQELTWVPPAHTSSDHDRGTTPIQQDKADFETLAGNAQVFLAEDENPETAQMQLHTALHHRRLTGAQSSLQLTPSLAAPRTYSFQETSLARRLHRACIEAAYHLLLNPARNPQMLHYAFRLSPLSRARVKFAAVMKGVLDRGPHEALDIIEALPFPRETMLLHCADQNLTNGFTLTYLPGHEYRQASSESDGSIERQSGGNISSENEWFDAYDVQAYLEGRGIYVNAGASFAEATLFQAPMESSSIANTPSFRPLPTSAEQYGVNIYTAWDPEARSVAHSDHTNSTIWKATSNEQINGVGFGQTMAPALSSKRTVTFDVAEFVRVLSEAGICLGRSPGFKRTDVDLALAASTFGAT